MGGVGSGWIVKKTIGDNRITALTIGTIVLR